MFHYELIDLLLFDLTTFRSLIEHYNRQLSWFVYLCLALNIAVLFLPRGPSFRIGATLLTATGWICSGWFFYVKLFSDLYWVSTYLGGYSILTGIATLYNLRHYRVPLLHYSRSSFAISTLAITLVSAWPSPYQALTLGTSATVAALSSLVLFSREKKLSSILVGVLSGLWLTLQLLCYVTLFLESL